MLRLSGRVGLKLGVARPSGGGWSPLALGSKLLAWWDAAQGITLSGNQVTAWADRKNGYTVTQAVSSARPVWSATSFNGDPGLTFDGTDDCLSADSVFGLPVGADSGEVRIVASQDAPGADTTARTALSYGGTSTDRRAILRQVITGVSRARAQAGNGSVIANADEVDVDLSFRHLIEASFAAASVSCEADGSGATSSAATVSTGSVRTRFGALPGGTATNFWLGKMRDAVFTQPLTTEEAAKLQAFLLARRAL